MKQSISLNQFRDAFVEMNRENQFSYDGLEYLFEYLEEIYDGEYDLDVIALCCEFVEYDSYEEVVAAYNINVEGDELKNAVRVHLSEQHTSVVHLGDDCILFFQF